MDAFEPFDRLDFDDDQALDHKVDPERPTEGKAAIDERQILLAFDAQAPCRKFEREARLVRGLQNAGP